MSFPAKLSSERASDAGFTLIEVIVVLTLLAVALSVALPLARNTARLARLDTAAAQIAAHLSHARGIAIVRNDEVTVDLDLDGRRVSVEGSRRNVALPPTASIELIAARREVKGRRASIRFYPDGSSTGGTIRLHDLRKTVRIEVDWLTGRVKREHDAGASENHD